MEEPQVAADEIQQASLLMEERCAPGVLCLLAKIEVA
jgi:hypothetical protein